MPGDIIKTSPNPASLIEIALSKGAGMDQVKELMDLYERWEKNQAKKAFLDALSRFQSMIPALKKNRTANVGTKTGGQFSYKYADLGYIAEQIKKPLFECGLSYRFEFAEENAQMKVTCIVSHRDGHSEVTTMQNGKDASGAKNDIQQKGSTQTYLQRYSLIGALGLSTADEDDDGKNSGSSSNKQRQTKSDNPEEYLDQWRETVKQVKSRIELTGLYLKNKKVIESDPKIQAIFKERQNQLPENQKPVVLP